MAEQHQTETDDYLHRPNAQQPGKSFRLIKKLDSGAFGEIYQGLNIENHTEVAIKLEPANTKTPMLFYEAKLYQYLHREKELHGAEALWAERVTKPEKGLPQIYYCSNEGDYNVLVMQLLGPNLEDLFNICERKFQIKTTFCIAIQALERIEFLHSKNFVHRDIKPQNFCIGTGAKRGLIYMIDLAFAKSYVTKQGKHIPNATEKGLTGTVRFASINNHRGYEHSRRDDLESLAYMLIYFLKGQLPWQNLKYNTNLKKEKLEKVYDKKSYLTPEAICKGLPEEITQFLRGVLSLQFEEKPNYSAYKQSFEEGLKKRGFIKDTIYDWNLSAQRLETSTSVQIGVPTATTGGNSATKQEQ